MANAKSRVWLHIPFGMPECWRRRLCRDWLTSPAMLAKVQRNFMVRYSSDCIEHLNVFSVGKHTFRISFPLAHGTNPKQEKKLKIRKRHCRPLRRRWRTVLFRSGKDNSSRNNLRWCCSFVVTHIWVAVMFVRRKKARLMIEFVLASFCSQLWIVEHPATTSCVWWWAVEKEKGSAIGTDAIGKKRRERRDNESQ